MGYLSLSAVLSEMNQAEAQSRGFLDLSTLNPTMRAKPEEDVDAQEEPTMATPPVPAANLQNLIRQMLLGPQEK